MAMASGKRALLALLKCGGRGRGRRMGCDGGAGEGVGET